jgi:acyl dehydratase
VLFEFEVRSVRDPSNVANFKFSTLGEQDVTIHQAVPAELSIEELRQKLGQEVGVSPWVDIDQKRIDVFADVTEDHQFIHVDPVAAKKSPFGTTVAHGFLTLSMLSKLAYSGLPNLKGRNMGVNYGFDKVRFISPVPAGARIRGRFKLAELVQRSDKEFMMRYAVTVEIEGKDRPALSADWLTLSAFA